MRASLLLLALVASTVLATDPNVTDSSFSKKEKKRKKKRKKKELNFPLKSVTQLSSQTTKGSNIFTTSAALKCKNSHMEKASLFSLFFF
jgi:hypothetical protein